MSKLTLTPEIGGSYLSNSLSSESYDSAFANPASYIKAQFNIDLSDADVKAVKNEGDVVNLALPFYSTLGNTTSKVLSNDDLSLTSGGEILISVIAVSTVAAGVGTAVAAGAMAANGYNLDGSEIKGK